VLGPRNRLATLATVATATTENPMIALKFDDVLARVRANLEDRLELPLDSSKLAWHGRIILLKEEQGERSGAFEGDMVALTLRLREGIAKVVGATSPPRPLTHDLMADLIRVMGARVERIAITSRRDNTYYATISLAVDGHHEEVDARPSDALALAVRTDAPILVDEVVFDEEGLPPEALTAKLEAETPPGEWRSLAKPEHE
jgi:bifunctional DNase/RNase